MRSTASAARGAALLASTATAQFWTMGHHSLLRTRLDPIVSPGKVAGHVHMFSGSSAISPTMDHDKAVNAPCTSNKMSADMSGYWTPQLYYKHRNGTYSAIDGDGMVIYWLYRGFKDGEKPAEVPADFRIVAGNTTRDFDDQSISAHKAVSFECWGEGYGKKLSHLPTDHECENLRPQIVFPHCWNGKDSYLTDNSHVAYGIGDPENGPCPAGFVRIPTLFIENYYHPRARGFEWYPGSLVFANGDNHGLTFHADWLNGFPAGMLAKTFDGCPAMGPDFTKCAYLAQYENEDAPKCKVQDDPSGMMVDEPIGLDFPLAKLPGNNPEFNSSAAGGMPRVALASYVEQAGFVRATEEHGGVCRGNECSDYTGPGGSQHGGAGAAPMPVSSASSSSSASTAEESFPTSASAGGMGGGMGGDMGMTSATSTSTWTETETDDMMVATTMPTPTATATKDDISMPTQIGQNLAANGPVSVPQTGASGGAVVGAEDDEEEELICYRRKKKNARRSRVQGNAAAW